MIVPLDLIAAGTFAASAGRPTTAAVGVLALPAVELLLLLLPHAVNDTASVSAPTTPSSVRLLVIFIWNQSFG